jgi:Protein of unknown function (DUF3141)
MNIGDFRVFPRFSIASLEPGDAEEKRRRALKGEQVPVWEKSLPSTAFSDYVRDVWERSILFLDILRERGNQHEDMLARGVTSVLTYDSELVMRGDELPHPVNYSLLRIVPPDGAEVDDRSARSSSSIRVPGRDRGSAASNLQARSATHSRPGIPSISPALPLSLSRDSGSKTSRAH